MGSESSGEEIGSNIATNIKTENLLLAHYLGFPRWGRGHEGVAPHPKISLNPHPLSSKPMPPHVVPSHKDEAFFSAHGLAQWRRQINADVDSICRQRSTEAYSWEHAQWLRQVDKLCQEVSLHLAKKVTFILQSRSSDALPWILKRPNTSEVAARPQLVLPNPAFDKPRAPPPNKRQRIKACVDGTVDTLGHRWILGSESASNLTMRCEICGLYVQQVLLQDRFDQLMQHPCKDQPSVLPASWGIQHSHNMLTLGVYWVCLTCEKLQRPVSEHAAKPLKESCKGPPKKSGHHAKQAHANQKP